MSGDGLNSRIEVSS